MRPKRSGAAHGAICAGLIVFAHCFCSPALAALRPTVTDNSFKPDLSGWNTSSIRTAVQSDGKLVVAAVSNSVPVIARLNDDGSRDSSFRLDPLFSQWWPNGEQGNIEALASQPGGKILVAEWAVWSGPNGEYNYKNRLVRLNGDGSLDPTFKPPSELPVHIDYLYSLSDGRVFMGNNPGGCHNDAEGRWYLHNDGTLLASTGATDRQLTRVQFANDCGPFIASVALAPDGKLLVAGQFVRPGTNLIRLNADGTFDPSFKAQLPGDARDWVSAVAVQSDGKIVFESGSGEYFSQGGKAVLARLFPDGRPDLSFIPADEASRYSLINSLVVRADDKILVGPNLFFSGYSLRLKRDGALDLDLATVAAPIGGVSSAVLDQADRVVGLLTVTPRPNGTSAWYAPSSFGRFFTRGTTIPGIEFAQAIYSVNENDPTAVVALRRSGDITKPLSVRITTQDGTAKAGADYVARTEVVQFAADEDTRSFQIPMLDDPIVEGNETVMLALSEPNPGAIISGRDTAVLKIVDNEQPTLLDPKFNAVDGGIVVLPDGKVFNLGLSSTPDGTTDLTKLNADGSMERSFVTSLGQNVWVRALAIQPDGKILLGVTFTHTNNATRTKIVRFNSDGSVDTDFNPVFDFDGTNARRFYDLEVSSLVVQSDGKIVAGGSFGVVNGSSHNSIVRFNPNGTVDSGFQSQVQDRDSKQPGQVSVMLLQDDGKILIDPWPRPALINGQLKNRPVRFNSDGTTDESFVSANTFGDQIALASNSKILSWTSDHVRRFNSDGSEDELFQFTVRPDQSVWALLPTKEGEVLLGVTETYGFRRLLRLGSNGTILNTYSLGLNFSLSILGEANGALLVTGSFDGVDRPLARLLPLGNAFFGAQFSAPVFHEGEDSKSATVTVLRTGDTSSALKVDYVTVGDPAYAGKSGTINFAPLETTQTLRFPILDDTLVNSNREFNVVLTNAPNSVLLGAGPATQTVVFHDDERPGSMDFTFTPPVGVESYGNSEALALQSDGKVLAAGVFVSLDGERYTTLDRLNQDGSRDGTFEVTIQPDFGWGASATISFIVPRPDGKIVVGGKHPVARLEANGALDESFDAGSVVGKVNAMAVQSDEKVLVAGTPPSDGQPAQPVLVRLQPDGQLDPSFTVATNITQVTALTVQPDGKILTVGRVDGIWELLRLEKAGVIDATFKATAVTNRVPALALQSDGKVLVRALGANSTERLVRVNSDGSVDPSFIDTGGGSNATAIAVQSDGRILLAGGDVWRLNADGSVDASFDTGSGPQGSVNRLALQPDGRVIVAGTFAEFDGAPRSGIARLHGDPELRFTGLSQRPGGLLQLTWISLPGRQYILQVSSDLSSWNAIRTNIATSYSAVFEDLPFTGTNRFYRVLRGAP